MSSRPPLQGFNHNVRHGARVYHVQTEDSGLDHPHLFTHLYYRGLILASARTDYSELAQQPGHETAVRKLMQEQHKALMRQLRHGAFDEKIAALLGTEDAAQAGAAPEGEAGAAATAPELARDGLEGAPTNPAALEAQRAAPETPQALVIDAIPAMPSGAVAADQLTAHADSSTRPDVADTQRIAAPDAAPPARDGTRRPAPAALAGTTQPQESRSRPGRGLEGALEWARGSGSASELEAEPTLVQRIELHAPAEPEEHPQGAAARATPSVGAQTRPRLAPDAAVGQGRAGTADRRAAPGAAPAVRGPSATHPSPTPPAGGPRAPRPSGTYAVPTWARASTEAPPIGRTPASPGTPVEGAAPRAASTPQRYTAPSAKSAGRGRRATGSYAPIEGTTAPASGGAAAPPSATQIAARPAVPSGGGVYRISTLGGARPSGAVAARGGGQSMPAVVARPAVVVDRAPQPGRAPGSASVTGLTPAAARAMHQRSTPLPPPAAIGTVPPKRPTASPPATPSSATNPRPFGADLISERSLDEVILQYLSEENDGGR